LAIEIAAFGTGTGFRKADEFVSALRADTAISGFDKATPASACGAPRKRMQPKQNEKNE